MKRKRNVAMIVLMAAVIAMLLIGFYLGATHQEARPADSSSPGNTP